MFFETDRQKRRRLTWNVKHLRKSLPKNIGTVDAIIHGDILDGNKGTDIQRSSPRVLAWTTNTQIHHFHEPVTSQPCFRTLLTRVFAHVNKAEGLSGSVQCPLHHVLRGPDKGVNRSVGGGSRVHVQQAAPWGVADCRSDGINDLKHEKNDDNYQIKRDVFVFTIVLLKQWQSVTDKYWKCGNKWTGMFYLLISALREVWDALHQPSHGSTVSNSLTVHRSILQAKKRKESTAVALNH